MMTPYSDQIRMSLTQLIILICVFLFSGTSSADIRLDTLSTDAGAQRDIIYQDGELAYTLPTMTKTALLEQLALECQSLTKQSVALQKTVDQKQFGKSDLLVTLLLPGGLLYSAIKKHQLEQAEIQLKNTNTRLFELTHEQLVLEYSTLNAQVAMNN